MSLLPNLLIVGAAKSGTTSLHNYLNQHPDVFMCSPKEPHFLINKDIGEKRIPNGIIDIDDYKLLFKGNEYKKYRGESSVMYLQFPEITISNIKRFLNSDVKIIIMLRNPTERAYSGYQHVKRYNVMEKLTFEEALKYSEERYMSVKNMTPASRYLELGMYFSQVKSFLSSFQNVHVIIYDDFKLDACKELRKVFDFLELDQINVKFDKRHMIGGWEWKYDWMRQIMIQDNIFKKCIKTPFPSKEIRFVLNKIIKNRSSREIEALNPKTEEWLKSFYKKDIAALSKLLDRDLTNWNS